MLTRAFTSYRHRYALGTPVADAIQLPVQCPHKLGPSPLAAAANVVTPVADGYAWITYEALGTLSTRTAKGLSAISAAAAVSAAAGGVSDTAATGSRCFVGISGLNSVEWSVVDFATMLFGGVSVGLHMTSNTTTVRHIVHNAGIAVLACPLSKLFCRGNGDSWSVESLLVEPRGTDAAVGSLPITDIVVMDADRAAIRAHCGSVGVASGFGQAVMATHNGLPCESMAVKGSASSLRIHSLLAWVSSAESDLARCINDEALPDPDALPVGGQGELVTLLYTSGSSVRPAIVIPLLL